MLSEFGDMSPDNFHEEDPTDIDGPARAPQEDPTNQPILAGAPKDAHRTLLKEYLRENYVPRKRRGSDKRNR